MTYRRTAEGVHVPGEEGIRGGRLACVAEVSLDDAVIPSGEVELDHVAHGGLDFVGREAQLVVLTNGDLDGRCASLHR